ncbi:MAG TPA: low molecular weight protein arginine phosphatase [Opitutaceae bacterium]|jgi:protein-tyrosine-phosphatase|nr:low molecular weight protein arginine phosphatase [Opitutaceae bacterium]
MARPRYVLIVCTANICRSPMAAGLLRHALAGQPEPVRSIGVISAGVSARSGEPVTDHSVTTLKKVGIDISDHVSRPITQELLDGALAVFCMTESHKMLIEATANPPPRQLHLFRAFMKTADKDIPDPFGGPLAAYEAARDEMVEALPSVVEFLKSLG